MSETKEQWVSPGLIWLQAWCAAVTGGREPWQASKDADACVKDIKQRFDKTKEETK